MTDATEEPNVSPRLPRFSLRSLVLAVLVAGSGYGLWAEWEPWVRTNSQNAGDAYAYRKAI